MGVSHFDGLAVVRGPGMGTNWDPPTCQPFEETGDNEEEAC